MGKDGSGWGGSVVAAEEVSGGAKSNNSWQMGFRNLKANQPQEEKGEEVP